MSPPYCHRAQVARAIPVSLCGLLHLYRGDDHMSRDGLSFFLSLYLPLVPWLRGKKVFLFTGCLPAFRAVVVFVLLSVLVSCFTEISLLQGLRNGHLSPAESSPGALQTLRPAIAFLGLSLVGARLDAHQALHSLWRSSTQLRLPASSFVLADR